MKTTSVDPQSVIVAASIDFHTAIKAIQEYAAKYPIERVSREQALAIADAARLLAARKDTWEAEQSISTSRIPRSPETLVICPADPAPHPWSACGSSSATIVRFKSLI